MLEITEDDILFSLGLNSKGIVIVKKYLRKTGMKVVKYGDIIYVQKKDKLYIFDDIVNACIENKENIKVLE
jgi:hypothetical protein